jgi:hypothetical protein
MDDDYIFASGTMRGHANSRITLEVYTQAVTSHKRAAQSKVVRTMVPNLGAETDELQTKTGV